MKNKRVLVVISLIISCLGLLFILGRAILTVSFQQEVKNVLAASDVASARPFSLKSLDDLPEPVQRYFRHVLPENQALIRTVRLKHKGQFKTGLDKPWIPIKGEQYFATPTPAYVWKGTTSLFTARDMYIHDKGRLVVSLFSWVNIVDARGEKYNEGELQRWLAESVWFPTNLLPSERLEWLAIDKNTARLSFKYLNLSLDYLVHFSKAGEIIRMETNRYMNEGKKETWILKMKDYKRINGVIVPTTAEATWRIGGVDFPYASFRLTRLEYNVAEMF